MSRRISPIAGSTATHAALLVAGLGVLLAGLVILLVGRLVKRYKGMPVLSQFTLYLVGCIAAGAVAVLIGNPLNTGLAPLFGTSAAPGFLLNPVVMQVVFFLAILIGGAFAAEVSFLFGLPVLTLGTDYFGIATLGFSIVVQHADGQLRHDPALP